MPEQPTHTFFNSRCAEYKTPFGAVPAGQTVTWRLTVPERLGYVDPHLVLTKDREDPVHYRMDFDGQTPGVNHFVFQLAPTTSGLYFYHFDLYTDFRRIYRDAGGEGVTARELVEEARRVARNYAGGDHGRFSRIWRDLSPAVYTLMGAAGIGLVWLTVWLI